MAHPNSGSHKHRNMTFNGSVSREIRRIVTLTPYTNHHNNVHTVSLSSPSHPFHDPNAFFFSTLLPLKIHSNEERSICRSRLRISFSCWCFRFPRRMASTPITKSYVASDIVVKSGNMPKRWRIDGNKSTITHEVASTSVKNHDAN
jgi:hypothetical protein